jgi:hypothetical protein
MNLAGASINDGSPHPPAELREGVAETAKLGLGCVGPGGWGPSTVNGAAEVEKDDSAMC